jgi:hypothetical protein
MCWLFSVVYSLFFLFCVANNHNKVCVHTVITGVVLKIRFPQVFAGLVHETDDLQQNDEEHTIEQTDAAMRCARTTKIRLSQRYSSYKAEYVSFKFFCFLLGASRCIYVGSVPPTPLEN